MTRTERAILVFAALACTLAFLVLDPIGPTAGAWWRAAQGSGAALCGMLAAAGAGAAVLQRLAPDLLEDGRGAVHAVITGLLLWSVAASGLAMAGLLHPEVARLLVLLLATGWLFRPPLQWPRLSSTALLIGLVVLLPGLVIALAPPVDTDELYQHLALPARMLDTGGLL